MKKILLIEDNPDIRENVKELLELAGYHVLTACDGRSGVSMATSELPDLVLSDVTMPHVNGHQLFDMLRNSFFTQHIPVIFITSTVEKKEIQYAFSKGIDGYIQKPFEASELYDVVSKCLKCER